MVNDLLAEGVQSLLKPVGVRAFGLGQRFEPVGDFGETLVARGLGHARVHIGILVGLTGNGGLEVVRSYADREAGGRVATLLEILKVSMGVAGFTFSGGAEYGGHIVVALYVGLGSKIQIAAVGLGFTG